MGRIVVSENVSLDSVVEDPTGDEGSPVGGWFLRASAADRAAWAEVATAEAMGAAALLFGRRSYEWFASRWPQRTGPWADRLNAMPKHVVTSTTISLTWPGSTVLAGPLEESVARLRTETEGDVVVYASGRLVRTLLERELVDELRLVVFPFVLGRGERLFAGSGTTSWQLVDERRVGDSLALLSYAPARRRT